MASQARSCKLPPDLAEVAELRARALGYQSWNAYVCGLIRYDAMVQGAHAVTLPISHMRAEDRDAVDASLLSATREGIGQRGQLLSRILERANLFSGEAVTPEQVGRALAHSAAGNSLSRTGPPVCSMSGKLHTCD